MTTEEPTARFSPSDVLWMREFGRREDDRETAPDDALRETAWRTYQDRLGNLTSAQEAAIERAFKAGWAARSSAR